MTIDQIRTLYDAQPFQSFVIHMADGRQVPVEHHGRRAERSHGNRLWHRRWRRSASSAVRDTRA